MGTYNFRKDLSRSKQTTELAKTILENNSPAWLGTMPGTSLGFFITDVNNIKCDLHLITSPGGQDILVEVKEDFYCARSGNVAVEYECRGKPSGINATEANYWLYRVHTPETHDVWLMSQTDTLRQAIRDRKYHKEVTGGDYGSNTKMVLFSLDVFRSLGKELENKSESPIVHKGEH